MHTRHGIFTCGEYLPSWAQSNDLLNNEWHPPDNLGAAHNEDTAFTISPANLFLRLRAASGLSISPNLSHSFRRKSHGAAARDAEGEKRKGKVTDQPLALTLLTPPGRLSFFSVSQTTHTFRDTNFLFHSRRCTFKA